ncbi:MAG: hypothetical protein ACLGQH_05750 [Acidobacteriota bacterium]
MTPYSVLPHRQKAAPSAAPLSCPEGQTGPDKMPSPGPGLAVTRLAPGRWLAATRPDAACCLDIYLSPAEDGLIRALRRDGRLDIRIVGVLGEDGTANLGDCLVAALVQNVAHIGLELSDPKREQPVAVAGLLESLARQAARQGGRPVLSVVGDGPGLLALSRALAQGRAARCGRRRRTGDRP